VVTYVCASKVEAAPRKREKPNVCYGYRGTLGDCVGGTAMGTTNQKRWEKKRVGGGKKQRKMGTAKGDIGRPGSAVDGVESKKTSRGGIKGNNAEKTNKSGRLRAVARTKKTPKKTEPKSMGKNTEYASLKGERIGGTLNNITSQAEANKQHNLVWGKRGGGRVTGARGHRESIIKP